MNKATGKENGLKSFLKRFNYKLKDVALLCGVGLALILVGWMVFHADDEGNEATMYATEAETKVARLLQEIDGVGDANVIVYEHEGDIESVVVVCDGAKDLRVVMNVREAVASALGTEQKSVKIYLKKE